MRKTNFPGICFLHNQMLSKCFSLRLYIELHVVCGAGLDLLMYLYIDYK